jgi:HAD superfamily hydrolase (TIGR01490 family)
MKIAFFDFDGTITRRDTLFEIIRFQKGSIAMYAGMLLLSPVLVMFRLKLLSNQRTKEIVLGWFFRDTSLAQFRTLCEAFCRHRLPTLLRPAAVAAIKDHQSKGHLVVVVTASAQDWVAPWCVAMGITCIATKLEVKDERLTGKILGLNCNGEEKVCRIRAQYQLEQYENIYAYGDSNGDKAMLAIAGTAIYKPFRTNA